MQAAGDLGEDDAGDGGCGGRDHRRAEEDPTLPRRRDPWIDPPIYGRLDPRFSATIHHGGFFCGIGQNRMYLDEQLDTFDELDRGSFCCVFIDKMISDLGYTTADPRIRVYWCKEGHTLADGLVAINFEKNVELMKKASKEEKLLHIFVDHVNLLEKQRWHKDKQVEQPEFESTKPDQKSEDVDSDGGDVMSCCSAYSEDGDSDFVDSDYELDDDDEHWKENVDLGVKDALFDNAASTTVHMEKHPDIDVGKEEDLEVPCKDTYKYRVFDKETDMADPTFKLGMLFGTMKEVREAMAMYCVKNRIQLKKKRNNNVRFDAVCGEGCPWNFVATKHSMTDGFVCSKFVDKHTCEKVWSIKELTAPLLAKEYLDSCEVFNRMILEARELPIMSMLENIYEQMMTRNYNKSKEALQDWSGQICPKIKDKLNKNVEWSADFFASPFKQGVFKVTRQEAVYIVELNLRSCSCRRWQLTGIPCTHACACFRNDRLKPEQFVSHCYSIHTYMQAYGSMIRPVRDKLEWTKTNGPAVQPPYYEKVVGRPKKSRRKSPEEKADGTKLSKHGVIIHCGYCRDPGHNKSGCPRLKELKEAEAALAAEEATNQAENASVGENVAEEEAPVEPRPKRRRRTIEEKVDDYCVSGVSIPNCTRGPTQIDEYGDADVPEILHHIDHVDLDPRFDPSELNDSMVNALNHEVPTIIFEEPEPFPEESTFVSSYRQNIPATRVTTATSSGMAILRGGRGRGRPKGAATPPGRGTRGTRLGTTGARGGTAARGAVGARGGTAAARVVAGARGGSVVASAGGQSSTTIPMRGRGRAEWLLFGDGSSTTTTASQGVENAVEIDASQAAPDDLSQA